jgi:hypothetical protein
VHRVAVVGPAEVRVAVVDLVVADLERRIVHDLVDHGHAQEAHGVDLDVAPFDPGLLVVTRG